MGYLNSVLLASGIQGDGSPVSGGGLSQNSKFSYGYASSPGKRSSMEDFYETRIDGVDGEIVGLFGVFDGHGGARAAQYVKQNLFSNLIKHPKFFSDTKSAIEPLNLDPFVQDNYKLQNVRFDAYSQTDSEFLKSENNHGHDAGSTASTAILVGNRLLVANVGDSRAVICRAGNGTWRVGGVLAVSRAFGDKLLKQYVVADPEIQVQ
ncbi:putative protein phosphatase 2C 59 [Dendrobium catenatum]|uniref:protein-serine/threonine phosphatase n=1 Tax=Dendrobium catenatum TaxID=906689 RepID=A0A2I0XAE4_9ASPA|nr:putative protein phosphatase 2C 59 [Dendrobium catenatum]